MPLNLLPPLRRLAAWAWALALAACGGGGADAPATASGPPASGGGGVAPSALTGLVAIGAALPAARVTARCRDGRETSGLTNAAGQFDLPVGVAVPCMLRAEGGSPAVTLYSWAAQAGRINITPYTDLTLGKALRAHPATWFERFGREVTDLTQAQRSALADAGAFVQAMVATAGGSAHTWSNGPWPDPFTEPFAIGDERDRALDALFVTLRRAGLGYPDLVAFNLQQAGLRESLDSALSDWVGQRLPPWVESLQCNLTETATVGSARIDCTVRGRNLTRPARSSSSGTRATPSQDLHYVVSVVSQRQPKTDPTLPFHPAFTASPLSALGVITGVAFEDPSVDPMQQFAREIRFSAFLYAPPPGEAVQLELLWGPRQLVPGLSSASGLMTVPARPPAPPPASFDLLNNTIEIGEVSCTFETRPPAGSTTGTARVAVSGRVALSFGASLRTYVSDTPVNRYVTGDSADEFDFDSIFAAVAPLPVECPEASADRLCVNTRLASADGGVRSLAAATPATVRAGYGWQSGRTYYAQFIIAGPRHLEALEHLILARREVPFTCR